MNKFKSLNKLVEESRMNYNFDSIIKDIDMSIECIDEAYENYQRQTNQQTTSSQQTYNEAMNVSKEALQFAQMTPQQCQAATATPQAMRQSMPASSQAFSDEQLSGPEKFINDTKFQLKRAAMGSQLFTVMSFMMQSANKGMSYMLSAKGMSEFAKTSIGLWMVAGYGLCAAAAACFKIKRKFLARKQNKIQENYYLKFFDEMYQLENIYSMIQESVASKSTNDLNAFADKGLTLMSNLGAQIKSDSKGNVGKFDKVCLMVEKAGVVCMVKVKGNIARMQSGK